MAKYDPLFEHLCNAPAEPLELTFTRVAQLVGGLPESAQKHAAWWSNEQGGRHVQAKAWLDAGREVEHVDRSIGPRPLLRSALEAWLVEPAAPARCHTSAVPCEWWGNGW